MDRMESGGHLRIDSRGVGCRQEGNSKVTGSLISLFFAFDIEDLIDIQSIVRRRD